MSRCHRQLGGAYEAAERALMPMIRVKAYRAHRLSGIDYDELIQEGRIALLNAVRSHDEKRGPLRAYAGVVLDNCYRTLLAASATRAQREVPLSQLSGLDEEEEGQEAEDPRLIDPGEGPDVLVERAQLEELARSFRGALSGELSGRDLEVYRTKLDIETGDTKVATNIDVARMLGVSKNMVDWSLSKIRRKFVEMSSDERFSDLFDRTLEATGPRRESEMAKASKTKLPPPPPCVGTYESDDTTCNGDPKGRTKDDRAHCAWRDRCAGITFYCDEEGLDPEELAEELGRKGLAQLGEDMIVKLAIVDGQITAEDEEAEDDEEAEEEIAEPDDIEEAEDDEEETEEEEGQPEPPKKVAKAAKPSKPSASPKPKAAPRETAALAKKAKAERPVREKKAGKAYKLTPEMQELYDHFVTRLKAEFKGRPVITGENGEVAIEPGSVYSVDRLASSRYVGWYIKTGEGRDRGLCGLYPKVRLGTIHVRLGAEYDAVKKELGAKTFKRLNARAITGDGQFKTECLGMDKEGLGLCAETLRRLVKSGKIEAPDVN